MLPDGYILRHTLPADVPALQRLLDAVETADSGRPRHSEFDIAAVCRDPRMELTTNTWSVVGPEHAPVAFAVLFWGASQQGESEVMVHPDHRGRGIEDALVGALESRAAELAARADNDRREGQPRLHIEWAESLAAGRGRLEERGYVAVRESFEMGIDLVARPVYPSPLPPGLRVAPLDLSRDEHRVYRASQEAFADHFLFEASTLEEWRSHTVDCFGFDPSLWSIAWDGEDVAGEALLLVSPEQAYVGSLSVRVPWRGRGLGLALLTRAFDLARQRGHTRVWLGVDAQNETGALALYEKAGMQPERRWVIYARDISVPTP